MNLYRRVVGYYRPYLGTISFSFVLLVIGANLNLLKFVPVQWVIDHVITVQPGNDVHWGGFTLSTSQAALFAAVAMVAIYMLAGLFGFWRSYVSIEVGLKALLELRTQLYAYLQYLPLHFHDRRRSGDSTFRVAYDSQAVQTFYNRGFDTILGSSVTLITTFLYMLGMDGELACVSLLVLPLLWYTIYIFSARVRRQTTTLQQEESDVLSRASEGLTSIRIVHAFGQEEYEVREFVREARESYAANLKLTITNAVSSLAVTAVMTLGIAIVLYVATPAYPGRLSHRGSAYAFSSLTSRCFTSRSSSSVTPRGRWKARRRACSACSKSSTRRTRCPSFPMRSRCRARGGEIAFENVAFAYDAEHPILAGITLQVKPGQTVALVGGTGAGKTTLLSLVPRFYDPASGPRADRRWRRAQRDEENHCAPTSPWCCRTRCSFPARCWKTSPTDAPAQARAEIEAAAEAAQAHAFIAKLPHGYDTQVGERGVRLSGGQKQRIGLARAFLKNAPILLLDEPTSALDLETEAEIMGTLHTLMRRFTTLIVTHRLSTIHHVDCIHVLEAGRLVESGTGPELLARNGVYARLWKSAMKEAAVPV